MQSYSSAFVDSTDLQGRIIANGTDFISNILFDCAVPAYIMISAILLYSKVFNWKSNLKRKAVTLLVPYFIFNTLWILVGIFKVYVLHRPGGGTPNYLSYTVYQWVDAFLGIQEEFKPAFSILWYVRGLFLLNIFALPIKKLIDKFPRPVLIVIAVIWFSCVKSFFIQTYALTFFVLGYYIVKNNIHMKLLDKINPWIFTAIYIVFAGIDFYFKEFEFIHRGFVIVAILYAVMLSRYAVSGKKFLRIVGPAVFFIYLTHRFVYLFINMFFANTLKNYAVLYFVKPIIAHFLGTIAFYILIAYFPSVLTVLTGGRSRK